MTRRPKQHPSLHLPPYDPDTAALNAIIETPRGSRNKFAYDPDSWLYQLTAVLPEGSAFPHAFGFVPSTLGDDGDPLDVMVLMDEPVYPGCLVPARLIGVIQARQTERDGTAVENDRLVAVSTESHTHAQVRKPDDLTREFIKEIEAFFIFYNKARGKKFQPRGWKGPRAAAKLIERGQAKLNRTKRKQ